MKSHRLFNLFIVIGLVAVVVLTVRKVSAKAVVTSMPDVIAPSSSECASLPSRYSIHAEYVKEMGGWLTRKMVLPVLMAG